MNNKLLFRIINRLDYYFDKFIFVPKIFPKISKEIYNLNINSIKSTAYELLHSNKSIGRFGDGEIKWILNIKQNSFEKESSLLRIRLLEVLQNNNNDFMIGLPDGFTINNQFISGSKLYWQRFISKYGSKFVKYLNKHKQYYNTSVSRPYIDYNTKHLAEYNFKLLKKLWFHRNILIIEGNQSRLGVKDDLLNNVNKIKRIECPSTNAFEYYNSIFANAINFLNKHYLDNYLVLISLGPTATILSYDLFNQGYRSIDIGHIDIEYEWYLMGAKEKVDIPYKYVNENTNGKYALPVSDKTYYSEIICRIE